MYNFSAIHCFSSAPAVKGPRKQLRPRRNISFRVSTLDTTARYQIESTTTTLTAFPDTTSSSSIEWIPTRIEFEGVYRSYGQPSLWRKLTSSVPRREFALQDITVAFGKTSEVEPNTLQDDAKNEDSFCLLVGASSSGKSTIFRSLLEAASQGTDDRKTEDFGSSENRGNIRIQQSGLPDQSDANPSATAKPILLDDRGEINTLSSGKPKTTLGEAWTDSATEILERGPRVDKYFESYTMLLVNYLANDIFHLDPEALLDDLTPSEKYRFCLGKACIESSFGAAVCTDSVQLPGPILLLDEWMDVETSTVVRKVQPSLHKIVEDLNGVVLSITHKPDLYARDISSMRRVTLSGGKLLSDY